MPSFEYYKNIIVPVLKRYAVKQAAVFGSMAKGTMTADSDIDLLIEPAENFTLFNLLQLQEEISQATQIKTDIVEYKALKPTIRTEVLQTAIQVL